MPRVKRGVVAHRRHKKILKKAKGYYGARSRVFRVAKQAVTKAGQYAYRDRLLGDAVAAAAGTVVPLGRLHDLVAARPRLDAALHSCHRSVLLSDGAAAACA